MESLFDFSVDVDTGRLFAESLDDFAPYEFVNGAWEEYDGALGVIMDSRPITEAEAMLLTCGAMPL